MLGSPTTQTLMSPLSVVPSKVVLGTPPNIISKIPLLISSLPANEIKQKVCQHPGRGHSHIMIYAKCQLLDHLFWSSLTKRFHIFLHVSPKDLVCFVTDQRRPIFSLKDLNFQKCSPKKPQICQNLRKYP